jgi:hypothetical protein
VINWFSYSVTQLFSYSVIQLFKDMKNMLRRGGIVLYVLLSMLYMVWRVGFTLNMDQPVASILFLFVDVVTCFSAILFVVSLWRKVGSGGALSSFPEGAGELESGTVGSRLCGNDEREDGDDERRNESVGKEVYTVGSRLRGNDEREDGDDERRDESGGKEVYTVGSRLRGNDERAESAVDSD